MSSESTDLAALSAKVGQLIRTSELKVAGKLLATARGHLHQIAEKDPVYHFRYEHMAELRNDLMEPGADDFAGKQLLARMLDEEHELRKVISQHPNEHARLAHTLLGAAAAVVLVHCQDLESDAPLDF